MGFATLNESQAQQPPAWSPQPYAKPNGSTSDLPVNSLRDTPSASQTPAASNSTVARWRKIEQAAEPRARSYTNAFDAPVAQSQPAQPEAVAASEQIVDDGFYSEQSAAPVVRRNAVVPARKVVATNAVSASQAPELSVAANRVPTNTVPANTAAVSEVRPASAVSVAPASIDSDRSGEIRIGRSNAGSSRRNAAAQGAVVAVASYQDISEPPSLNLAPARQEPPRFQDNSGQSPLSPSDTVQGNRRGSVAQNESAYRLPETRSTVDCDELRDAIKQADITKIRIDTSPAFVEGYRSNQETTSKETFVQSSESRVWYNMDGDEVARGRLVDMGYGAVVIETDGGAKVNYLLSQLSEADHVYVAEAWGIPVTCSLNDGSFDSRDFVATTMTWKASNACHKPLYFEEVQLERYGHEWGPVAQPAISSLNFVKNVVLLPYKMGINPMNECQYSLGYYRPGSCAPWTVGPVPVSLRGAAAQAAVVGGAVWALP